MKTDSIFYKYFSYFPEAFFMLLGEDESKAKKYKFSSEEVKETRFQIDGIFQQERHKDLIYFTEFHFYRKDLYQKLFAEIFIYLRKYKPQEDWRAVVIYPNKSFDLGVGKHYKEFINSSGLIILYLDEIKKELINRFPLSLLKIIVLSDEEIPGVLVELKVNIEKEIIAKEKQENIKELIIAMILSKFEKLTIKEIEKMVKPFLDDFKKSRAAKELIREGKKERDIEIAKTMLKKGLRIEEISKYTGINKRELSSLLK